MNEDLKIRLIEYRKKNENSQRAVIKDKELKSDVIKFFENSEFSNLSLAEQSAIIIFGYKPKCDCGNFIAFKSNRITGYYLTEFGSWQRYCSRKCSLNSLEFKAKSKKTNLERYGFEHAIQHEAVKLKQKKTNIEKYGVDCALQSESIRSKSKQTNLERYGVEHSSQNKSIFDKVKQTNLIKYGVEHAIQNEAVKLKQKKTNIEKYGVDYVLQSDCIRNKGRATNLEKYGVEHVSNCPAIRNKAKATNLERYGVEYAIQNEEIKFKYKATNLERYGVSNYNIFKLLNKNPEFCSILESGNEADLKTYITSIAENNNLIYKRDISKFMGYNYSSLLKLLNRIGLGDKYTNYKISYSENELFEFISGLIPESTVIQSDRTILSGKELDIYIPDHNLAIEFNGIYWHSESNGKDSNYHWDKTNICSSNGIQLLHIYDTEWNDPVKKEIWKSIIKSKLGLIDQKIPARKCEFKIISPKQSREFLEVNHLNGFCGAEVHYGLFYNDDLISTLSIGKSRFNRGEFEIIRFASKINTLVQGGFSKLLKHIDSKYKFNLVTFADRRYSNGSTYRRYFKVETETSPNWYGFNINEYTLKHRFSFQKHKLKELFGSTFDENLTAYENMLNHDFDRIWDVGNFKFSTLINS